MDEAIRYWPRILEFLSQDVSHAETAAASLAQLEALFAEPVGAEPGPEAADPLTDLQGAADA